MLYTSPRLENETGTLTRKWDVKVKRMRVIEIEATRPRFLGLAGVRRQVKWRVALPFSVHAVGASIDLCIISGLQSLTIGRVVDGERQPSEETEGI